MFERRLKILLIILIVFTIVLVLRAVQVQVIQRNYWRERATETMQRSQLIETVRGRLLDYRGREIAIDSACIDACVDYRAIPREPDDDWLRDQAMTRMRASLGDEYKKLDKNQRRQLLEDEISRVKTDLEIMWATLAKLSKKSIEEIDDIRRTIVHRVEMRRRYVWYHNYESAMTRRENRDPEPWYKQWLIDETTDAPQLDSFAVKVAEQEDAHVILRAIDTATNNYLAKNIDRFPGLVLRPSTHRIYPYGEAGCHLIGHLSRVAKDDVKDDPNIGNERLQYYYNDLIGRTGLEALCEPVLRGERGSVQRVVGEDRIIKSEQPEPGADATTTIDIELQREIQLLFKNAPIKNPDNTEDRHEMHGAAVVIDVKTGELRALVSSPAFDLNDLDDQYTELSDDDINKPLLNRATQAQLEPGSTIKPIVGLSAITQGVFGANETIECTGYLVLNGKRYGVGRCWVASKFGAQLGGGVAHHPVPWDAPHPTGFLTFPDALERSCNVFFETLGDRLGIEGESVWYDRFGLGRETGVGIAEAKGRLPRSFHGPAYLRKMTSWFAGIGQGQVAATPIQMANIAATIAREGVWLRPRLVPAGEIRTTRPSDEPDRVDLHLSREALAEVKQGMINVVNGPAGTGKGLHRTDVLVAGKTGTAQAAKFSVPERDATTGEYLRDQDGRLVRRFLEPATKEHPTDTPWYRGFGASGTDVSHAWYIGFAPANKPTIAFCVLVEYGGSGGITAAPIARDVLEACVEHGYLSLDAKQ